MTTKEQEEAEQWAFEAFCGAHPHEAYATWPERFWAYFQKQFPHVSREEMESILKESEEATN